MCTWHMELMGLVAPVLNAMRMDAAEQPYLCTGATGVLVQVKEKCRHGVAVFFRRVTRLGQRHHQQLSGLCKDLAAPLLASLGKLRV